MSSLPWIGENHSEIDGYLFFFFSLWFFFSYDFEFPLSRNRVYFPWGWICELLWPTHWGRECQSARSGVDLKKQCSISVLPSGDSAMRMGPGSVLVPAQCGSVVQKCPSDLQTSNYDFVCLLSSAIFWEWFMTVGIIVTNADWFRQETQKAMLFPQVHVNRNPSQIWYTGQAAEELSSI